MFIIGVFVINLIILQIQTLLDTLALQTSAGSKEHFRSLQLFGAEPHQIQRSAAGVLQPLSEETDLRQPQAGPGHDSSTLYRVRGVRGLA
jgi:hypothetical protein